MQLFFQIDFNSWFAAKIVIVFVLGFFKFLKKVFFADDVFVVRFGFVASRFDVCLLEEKFHLKY